MPNRAKIRIGVDLMGSESSPKNLLLMAESISKELPENVSLVAIGDFSCTSSDLVFRHASETIEMTDHPLIAIRKKKDSSLSVGMHMLKKKEIDAFVSAGNTGALVSSAKITLGMLPSCSRPALLALMPTRRRPLAVLDVGANLECKSHHLIQLALMGAAYQRARGLSNPSIGLLNIGSEAMKGTSERQEAYQTLETLTSPYFHFVGNVEGKTVFNGDLDILITDGFTGNVFLKTAEGIASLILDQIQEHIPAQSLKILEPQLHDLHSHLHYSEYPGALLLGPRGVVIKCHGHASPEAFAQGILSSIRIVQENLLASIQQELQLLKRVSAPFHSKRKH